MVCSTGAHYFISHGPASSRLHGLHEITAQEGRKTETCDEQAHHFALAGRVSKKHDQRTLMDPSSSPVMSTFSWSCNPHSTFRLCCKLPRRPPSPLEAWTVTCVCVCVCVCVRAHLQTRQQLNNKSLGSSSYLPGHTQKHTRTHTHTHTRAHTHTLVHGHRLAGRRMGCMSVEALLKGLL